MAEIGAFDFGGYYLFFYGFDGVYRSEVRVQGSRLYAASVVGFHAFDLAAGPNAPIPPILDAPRIDETGLSFEFPGEAGVVYSVEYTDSLESSWSVLTNAVGNGEVIRIVDPRPDSSARFYRVRSP